jgi:hypothetical protein
MRNIWTKVITTAAALSVGLFLTTSVALATDASNSNTGAGSTNNASVSINNNTTINSTNNATINNNISVTANTGGNSASQNTGNGTVSSGDITGSISVENLGNSNGVFASSINLNCGSDCNFSASNSQTGADSRNNSSVRVNNKVVLTVKNDADVDNNIGANLNTGGNKADKNTGDGTVQSGDINFSITVKNDLNKNQIGAPAPEIPEVPGPGVLPQPVVVPQPGKVLAAIAGLPITGGSLPTWPILLVAIGFALKLLEKVFKVRFEETA